METTKIKKENRVRLLIFLVAGALHIVLLIFVVLPPGKKIVTTEMPEAITIRLMDIDEERPPLPVLVAAPLPPPPPAYSEQIANASSNTVEAAAENMIEVDEVPDQVVVQGILHTGESSAAGTEYGIVYSQSSVSSLPVLPEAQIRRNVVYPRIALSSGIEGYVILELFLDSQGNILNISIIRETPENRGFGEAAINALNGIKAEKAAQAEGRSVAVRYRYPIRFTIR